MFRSFVRSFVRHSVVSCEVEPGGNRPQGCAQDCSADSVSVDSAANGIVYEADLRKRINSIGIAVTERGLSVPY